MATHPETLEVPQLPPQPDSTWRILAAHWRRAPGAEEREFEAQARRLEALQRWRGLLVDPGRPA